MPSRTASPGPSQKSLGKRKATAIDGANVPLPPARLRTRVLPSRSRRVGGPGIGSLEVDEIILDAQRRKFENEPLVSLDTKFLLGTDMSTIPAITGTSSQFVEDANGQPAIQLELNQDAFSRYFDRPEVIKACRDLAHIQTPDFRQIPPNESLAGRFRVRANAEDDITDEAYEKRHKKYESFEKRQRLREKEKLKHLQYKLRERIEQLRALDVSTFLALPASDFSPPPHTLEGAEPIAVDFEDTLGLMNLPGAHVNGAAAYNEGQRRREEMLANAIALEEKYAQLLDPDRPRPMGKKHALVMMDAEEPGLASAMVKNGSAAPLNFKKAIKKVSLTMQAAAPDDSSDSTSESEDEYATAPSKGPRNRTQSAKGKVANSAISSSRRGAKAISPASIVPDSLAGESPVDASTSRGSRMTIMDVDGDDLSDGDPEHMESISRMIAPSGKRQRSVSQDQAISGASRRKGPAVPKRPNRPSVLEVAALHRQNARGGRASRNIQAFGYDIPASLEMRLQYDFPEWAYPIARESDWPSDSSHTVEDGDPPGQSGEGAQMQPRRHLRTGRYTTRTQSTPIEEEIDLLDDDADISTPAPPPSKKRAAAGKSKKKIAGQPTAPIESEDEDERAAPEVPTHPEAHDLQQLSVASEPESTSSPPGFTPSISTIDNPPLVNGHSSAESDKTVVEGEASPRLPFVGLDGLPEQPTGSISQDLQKTASRLSMGEFTVPSGPRASVQEPSWSVLSQETNGDRPPSSHRAAEMDVAQSLIDFRTKPQSSTNQS